MHHSVMHYTWAIAILAMSRAVLAAPDVEPTHEFFTPSDGVKIHSCNWAGKDPTSC